MKLLEFWILPFLAIIGKSIAQEIRVVCYVTNWSVYRPGIAKFTPQNVNPYLCTHLIYAFGKIEDDYTIEPFDEYQDITRKGYAQLNDLKTININLKTLLSFGGWGKGSALFTPLVADKEQRVAFAKTAIDFLRQHNFDGLDLLWQYPATVTDSKPEDRENLVQFVKELREAFGQESTNSGRPRLLLSLGVSGYLDRIEKGYNVSELNKYVDWFNLLSYDFHDSSEKKTNHHAPLFSLEERDMRNIDFCVDYLTGAGADLQKLVIGIPTYGRTYTLADKNTNQIGASSTGPGILGNATGEGGFLAYYEICENINFDEGWTVVNQNDQAMGPYAYKDDQWVSYDDENIVRRKAQYVAKNGLGGVMFWSLDTDDFRGLCLGRPYPLIEAAKDGLSTTQNQILTTPVPPSTPTPGSDNCGYAGNVICPNAVAQIIATSSTPEIVSDKEISDHLRENVLGRGLTRAQQLPTVASTITTQATSIIPKIPETTISNPAVITTTPIRLHSKKESAPPSENPVNSRPDELSPTRVITTENTGNSNFDQNDVTINIRINEPLTYRARQPNSQIVKEDGNRDEFVAETQQFAPVQRPRNTLINIFVW